METFFLTLFLKVVSISENSDHPCMPVKRLTNNCTAYFKEHFWYLFTNHDTSIDVAYYFSMFSSHFIFNQNMFLKCNIELQCCSKCTSIYVLTSFQNQKSCYRVIFLLEKVFTCIHPFIHSIPKC